MKEGPLLDGTLSLFTQYEREPEHPRQVARLALQLFDRLEFWHGSGEQERGLLEAASLLHDIGWAVSGPTGSGHHKASARLIRDYPWPGVPRDQVEFVAVTARYHRKALPNLSHADYAALFPNRRLHIRRIAALLRLADGLDRRHLQRVADVGVAASRSSWEFRVAGPTDLAAELTAADRKADLLRLETGARITFHRVPIL